MADKKTAREYEEYITKLLTEHEIETSKNKETIEQLRRENQKNLAELAALKRKDKASARAITLAERKSKYIQEVTKSRCAIEIDRLARLSERYSDLFDKLEKEDQKRLEQFNEELSATINTLSNLSEYIEDRKALSDAEKNYINEKERISLNDAVKSNLDERFNKLVTEFNIKVGESANRGRGRPKKADQSMMVTVNHVVADEKQDELDAKEKQEVIEKMNELFYSVKKTDTDTSDYDKNGVFDFDKALNPSQSLADIMKDI